MPRTIFRAWPAVAALLVAAPLVAQHHGGDGGHAHGSTTVPETGLRAELIRDIEQLESKYMALAEALTEHWAWSPAEGVRSVGAVFGHVAAANFMIPQMAGVESPSSYRGEEGTAGLRALEAATAETLLPELRHSFVHARHALARTPDSDLDARTQLFGREATKREVLTLLVSHMHEHLGQAIAYARTNGVVPPWNEGE